MASNMESRLATRLQFPDLEPVAPGTPVDCYLRHFWLPGSSVPQSGIA